MIGQKECWRAAVAAASMLLLAPLGGNARAQGGANELIALRAGHALDVTTGALTPDAVVLIHGERIEAIGSDLAIPAAVRTIDLGDSVLLPGLIDTHTHLLIRVYADGEAPTVDRDGLVTLDNPVLNESVPLRTVAAVDAARSTLLAGFTTIRDCDSDGAEGADVAIRDGIERGLIQGPRMQVSNMGLSITGGLLDHVGFAHQIDIPPFGLLVDSSDGLVHEIRRQIKYGADWVKIYATGTLRHLDPATMEPLAQFDYDDLKRTVDEAARFRRPVVAHAYGGRAAADAIRAGVRSIEHGMMLDDDTLDLMVEHGTFWVPTLSVYVPETPRAQWSELTAKIVDLHRDAFKRALPMGVRIAYGTDTKEHGTNARELEIMVSYGMSPLRAIRSATTVAAELMGMEADVGTLSPGKYADIIAVEANPLEDIGVLRDVRFVMKGGVVVKEASSNGD
ncbi:MAG TPA: amidohydrolase family protein [Acidobacteriota bacterium]|nr:amidohydrolase family protein [Acidobacteriota bacterium]